MMSCLVTFSNSSLLATNCFSRSPHLQSQQCITTHTHNLIELSNTHLKHFLSLFHPGTGSRDEVPATGETSPTLRRSIGLRSTQKLSYNHKESSTLILMNRLFRAQLTGATLSEYTDNISSWLPPFSENSLSKEHESREE